jgi:hypothetical protein
MGFVDFMKTVADTVRVFTYEGPDPDDPLWRGVKLVRAADLTSWERMMRYEDHDSPSYSDYYAERRRVNKIRREISDILKVRDRIREIDNDAMEQYATETLQVPRSIRPKEVSLPLPAAVFDETVYTVLGRADVRDGQLVTRAGWRSRELYVRLSCPSKVRHAEEIRDKRAWLESRSPEEKAKLEDVLSSWSAQPVLFISHRWEGLEHPDPNGRQLVKLRGLRDCLVIYDYSSFPQDPASPELALILENMTRLIGNVVVLASPEYVARGWCLYEYLIASIDVTVICDEVNDPSFVMLRRWSSTRGPVSLSLKGHSFESSIQNAISQSIIAVVDQIRPKYVASGFAVEADRELVTGLLVDKLLDALPHRKEYPSPYLGEWVDKAWTKEELTHAFTERLDWDAMKDSWDYTQTYAFEPDELAVPTTIEEVVRMGYKVERPPPMSELEGMARVFSGFGHSERESSSETPSV